MKSWTELLYSQPCELSITVSVNGFAVGFGQMQGLETELTLFDGASLNEALQNAGNLLGVEDVSLNIPIPPSGDIARYSFFLGPLGVLALNFTFMLQQKTVYAFGKTIEEALHNLKIALDDNNGGEKTT